VITGQLRLPAATGTPRSEPMTAMCGQPSKLGPRPLRCTMISAVSTESRSSRCAVASVTVGFGTKRST